MKNPLDNMMGNPLQAIDKLVEQARELERESKLSNTDWVEEQNYRLDDELEAKNNWVKKQLSYQ